MIEEWKLAQAPYSIAVDRGSRLIQLTLHGFWNDDDITAFIGEWTAALARMPVGGTLNVVLDLLDHAVQSQDSVERFGAITDTLKRYDARVAIVADKSLVKMQAQRIGRTDTALQVFETRDEAMAWLGLAPNPKPPSQ